MKRSVEHCVGNELNNDFFFQQDNAPCHKAQSVIVMKYLDDEGIKVIEHPPQSPDLNHIENIWRICEAKITNQCTNSKH